MIWISSRPKLILNFGLIQNPMTNLSWRLRFLSKFDHILIIVNRFWSFIQLESIKIDHFWSFLIKRSKKCVTDNYLMEKQILIEIGQKRLEFWHFWTNLNHFWWNSNYFRYKLTFSIKIGQDKIHFVVTI